MLAGLAAAPLLAASPAAAGDRAAAVQARSHRPAAASSSRPRPVRVPNRHAATEPRLAESVDELLPAARTPALAQDSAPRGACLAAARRAERVHDIPHGLLVAIALSESGLHAHALNIGGRSHFPESLGTARALLLGASAGTSVMAGCVQVNARVHARNADWPLDAERSADWGGALLRRFYGETGSWSLALRRWHGGTPAGSTRVLCRVRAKLLVTSPSATVLDGTACDGGVMARVRRSGAALLEVAEAPGR